MNITEFFEYIEEKASNALLGESIFLSINLSTLSDENYNKLCRLFQSAQFNTTSLQLHLGDMRLNPVQTNRSEVNFSLHIDDFFTMDEPLVNKSGKLINALNHLTTIQLHHNHLYAWRKSQWNQLSQLLTTLTSCHTLDVSHNRLTLLTESQWHLFSPILASLLSKSTHILLETNSDISQSSRIIQQRILYERDRKNPSEEVLEQIAADKDEIIALLQKACPAENAVYQAALADIQINREAFITRFNHLLNTWLPPDTSLNETHEWLSDSSMARAIQPVLSGRLIHSHYLALLAGDNHFFGKNTENFDETTMLQCLDFGCFLGEIDIVYHIWNIFPQYAPNKQYDLIEYACYSNKPQWVLNFIERYQVNINQSGDKDSIWAQIRLNLPEIQPILKNLSWLKEEKKSSYSMRDYQAFCACPQTSQEISHASIKAELQKITQTLLSIKFRRAQKKAIDPEPGFSTCEQYIAFLEEKKDELKKQLPASLKMRGNTNG